MSILSALSSAAKAAGSVAKTAGTVAFEVAKAHNEYMSEEIEVVTGYSLFGNPYTETMSRFEFERLQRREREKELAERERVAFIEAENRRLRAKVGN